MTTNQAPTATIAIDSIDKRKVHRRASDQLLGNRDGPRRRHSGASAITWRVDYLTTLASGHPALRPFVPEFSGQTSGTFTPATTGPYTLTDVAYRITLTVRDSIGRATTESLDVFPNVSNITLRTTPGGQTVMIDSQPHAPGVQIPSVVGFGHPIGAFATRTVNGFRYTFDSWSNGGAMSHTIVTSAADSTYYAKYVFQAKFNFQPAGVAVPTGYLVDSGSVFAAHPNGFTYGWNADISSVAIDRNAPNSPDQRYDTLIHLQRPVSPNSVWSLAVPNGTYRVRVVAGDPTRQRRLSHERRGRSGDQRYA